MVKKIVLRIWSNLNRYVVIELPMFLTLIALTGYDFSLMTQLFSTQVMILPP